MRKNERLYLDIHVLQTVPPSCINRDDTGSPKTAIYGGVTRARVSSQSWKRAIRVAFSDMFENEQLGVRTKRIVSLVAIELEKLGVEGELDNMAQNILINAGLKIKSVEAGTDALFFMSMKQAWALATLAKENPDLLSTKPSKETKEAAKAALSSNPSIDIALFGRMVADDPSLNTDACAQVAHSISTHKVIAEYDYFTAVDDLAPENNAGAGHIGTVEYNSATLYRYATLAVHELMDALGDDTEKAAVAFTDAFITSMPTGKMNTFANRTLPDAVMITLRKDHPINLAGAFERPVPASEEGFAFASAKKLSEHADNLYHSFATRPEKVFVVGNLLADASAPVSLAEMRTNMSDALHAILHDGGTR